ncbi:hypothetical protein SHIRM173S_10242 [Streptomyces hirsutus]
MSGEPDGEHPIPPLGNLGHVRGNRRPRRVVHELSCPQGNALRGGRDLLVRLSKLDPSRASDLDALHIRAAGIPTALLLRRVENVTQIDHGVTDLGGNLQPRAVAIIAVPEPAADAARHRFTQCAAYRQFVLIVVGSGEGERKAHFRKIQWSEERGRDELGQKGPPVRARILVYGRCASVETPQERGGDCQQERPRLLPQQCLHFVGAEAQCASQMASQKVQEGVVPVEELLQILGDRLPSLRQLRSHIVWLGVTRQQRSGADPQAPVTESAAEPIDERLSALDLDDVTVVHRQGARRYLGSEEGLIPLVGQPVPPEIGKSNDRQRARAPLPSGPAPALQEGSRVSRRLVLDDQPDVGIVEADLERGRRDDKIGVRIDARILGGGPADPQRSLVQVGTEVVSDLLRKVPGLPHEVTLFFRRKVHGTQGRQDCGTLLSAVLPVLPSLCVSQVVIQAVGDV